MKCNNMLSMHKSGSRVISNQAPPFPENQSCATGANICWMIWKTSFVGMGGMKGRSLCSSWLEGVTFLIKAAPAAVFNSEKNEVKSQGKKKRENTVDVLDLLTWTIRLSNWLFIFHYIILTFLFYFIQMRWESNQHIHDNEISGSTAAGLGHHYSCD